MLVALKSFSLRILWYVNIFMAFLLMLTYSAPYISPSTSTWLAILALGYPFLLLINIFWVIFWMYHRSRAVYTSFITILLGIFYIPTLVGFGHSESKEGSLRLMSYNIRYFNTSVSSKQDSWLKSQDEILAYIQAQAPSILCGQEFSGKGQASSERADKALKKMGLAYEHRGGGSSLAIYSRFPLENTGTINFEGSFNGAIHADVQLPDRKVRVYAVHLQSNRLGADASEVLKKDNLTTLNKKETQEKYHRIESKLSNALEMRAAQAGVLAAHIAKSPLPVIVCGDFNDTPLSYTYRLMSAGLQDSFIEKGAGFGTTYAGALPALRIDYILVGKEFDIHSHRIQSKAISDHYALTSEVSWKP